MLYQLKDKTLQKLAEEYLPDFKKQLNEFMTETGGDTRRFNYFPIEDTKDTRLTLKIRREDVEAVFDPEEWNPWPSVLIPKACECVVRIVGKFGASCCCTGWANQASILIYRPVDPLQFDNGDAYIIYAESIPENISIHIKPVDPSPFLGSQE